ncbi:major facilitator superfamily domain-containing protein [Aspergillus varians]
MRFWEILEALCLLAFVSSLDISILNTGLSTINKDIGGANQYIWMSNSFVVASCVIQSPLGGVAGSAHTPAISIVGRTVQGVGAGGMYVADFVPLRKRGKYLGLLLPWSALASALGPVVGGALTEANWRWTFYLGIPVCGLALVFVLLVVRVNKRDASANAKIIIISTTTRPLDFDYLGTTICVPSMTSCILDLVRGGVSHPWSSWRLIVPLVLDTLGWIAFHIQQSFAANPSIPSRLFTKRTSAISFFLTFPFSILVQVQSYYLPIYFLPFTVGTLISGHLLGVLSEYMPLHDISFALSALGIGLLTLLDSQTSTVTWIFLNFIRTLGYLWGVKIASVIGSAVIDRNIHLIASLELRAQVPGSKAYSFASQAHQIISEVGAFRVVWWSGLGIGLLGVLAGAFEQRLELRRELVTEYGIAGSRDGEGGAGICCVSYFVSWFEVVLGLVGWR